MNKRIKNFLVGIAIGTANIIPGVSGGTIAMTTGIYEELINIASNIFKDFKKNILYLLPIGIGMVLSILLLSKVITYTLNNYEFQTILFFAGLIVGGIPLLLKKTTKKDINIKNIIISIIAFLLIFCLTFLKGERVVDLTTINIGLLIKLFIVGIIAAGTMVIPGISGSFVLMLLGFYKPIVETISDLTSFNNIVHNIIVLATFGIGLVIGVVLIAMIIKTLLNKFPKETYYAIYGIVISSIIVILMGISVIPSILGIIVGIILFILGCFMGYKLS